MADRQVIEAPGAPLPIGAYSNGVRVGDLVFVAGQVALDRDGRLVGPGDVAAQTRQVFHNIAQVLEAAGSSISRVVETTTYLVGRESIHPFLEARTALFQELFPEGDYPANTLLIVDGLVREEFLVEVKAVAVAG